MRMLFNQDDLQDVISVLKFINNFTHGLGLEGVAIDTEMVESIVNTSKSEPFPHHGGLASASGFKQVATFMCFFVGMRPLPDPFPVSIVGPELAKIPNHQNAMVAFAIAEAALFKSIIKRKDGDCVVENPIVYSKHSYIDIIDALSNISHVGHFKMVTVLLEQMVYKSNPECQYPVI